MLFVILELWSWEEGNLKRAKELTGTVWSRKQHEPSRGQQAAVRMSVRHTAQRGMWHTGCHRGNTHGWESADKQHRDELGKESGAVLTSHPPTRPRALLVGVDVADGDGGERQLLELDGDGDRGAVVVHEELGALPEDERHGAEGQQDPEQAAQAAPGHHDAAAAVRVGVEAVPAHQLAQRRCLRAPHRQRPLQPRCDLLAGSCDGRYGRTGP